MSGQIKLSGLTLFAVVVMGGLILAHHDASAQSDGCSNTQCIDQTGFCLASQYNNCDFDLQGHCTNHTCVKT